MKRHSICVLGGTGFVGEHLVTQLAAAGHRVRVPTRHRERHRHLLVLPTVTVTETHIHDSGALEAAIDGCDVVINLSGILNEQRRGDFENVHVELPRKLGEACRKLGVPRLLHMSALNADADKGPSRYLKTKGGGEDIVQGCESASLHVTSFRPSVIFGPGDHFFNQFAALLRALPALPIPCPTARFAPVFVGDVVHAFISAIDEPATYGQRYDLCGPSAYSMHQLVAYTAKVAGLKRPIIALPDALSRLQGSVMGVLPFKPFSKDNYLTMQVDAVCSGPFPAVFEIAPRSVEAVVPFYLGRRDQRALYDQFRHHARHEY